MHGIYIYEPFWNNAVGCSYGKKAKTRKELFDLLLKALKNGELIIDLKDPRKFRGIKASEGFQNLLLSKLKKQGQGPILNF